MWRTHVLAVIVAQHDSAGPKIAKSQFNFVLTVINDLLSYLLIGFFHSVFGSVFSGNKSVGAFRNVFWYFGLNFVPFNLGKSFQICIKEVLAFQFAQYVVARRRYKESFSKQFKFSELPLAVVKDYLVVTHCYDESMQIHDLVKYNCTKFFQS